MLLPRLRILQFRKRLVMVLIFQQKKEEALQSKLLEYVRPIHLEQP